MPIRLLTLLAVIAATQAALGQPRTPSGGPTVDSQTFLEASQRQPPPLSAELTRHLHSLVDRMTLEEKVGQMTQLEIGMVTDGKDADLQINQAKVHKAVVQYGVGSILNVKDLALTVDTWHQLIAAIQSAAGETRLNIPILYGLDSIHGAN